jgi:plastocyanin
MTVAAGTTVNLENDDCCNPHAVNSNYPFNQTMDPGLTGSVTFNRAGKYTLWIDNNLSVVGTITVTS